MSEEFVFEDGRKAEKFEVEKERTKVIEIYVEPKPEKKLAQRIIEKYCVCEREIETIDEVTGEVINKVIEKVSDGDVGSFQEIPMDSSAKKLVEEKIKNKFKFSKLNMIIIGVIVVQLIGLCYLLLAS
jgi:hypothetical protein